MRALVEGGAKGFFVEGAEVEAEVLAFALDEHDVLDGAGELFRAAGEGAVALRAGELREA